MESTIRNSNLFIFFGLVTINCSFVFSQTPVLDVGGTQLQANTEYYIFSPGGGGGGGGGLSMSQKDPRLPCPLTVVQGNDKSFQGIPVKLFPVNNKQPYISMGTDLNIAFTKSNICVQPPVWRLYNLDPFTGRSYVKIGGTVGRPGAETVGNWFKLERSGQGYKIVYCPSVCSTCRVKCGDVGVYFENGSRWLGLGGQPLVIAFKKSSF